MAQKEFDQLVENTEEIGPCMTEYFRFMELPKELRGLVYQLIPQAQIVECRLVCGQWRTEIDEMYHFTGILDETKPGWERIFELKIKECTIRNLRTYRSDLVFKYPQLLKIIFVDRRTLSVANFQSVLSQCTKTLQSLTIVDRYWYSALSNSLSVVNFSNLTKLVIINFWLDSNEFASFHEFFSSKTLVSLRKLWIIGFCSLPLISKVTCTIFALLAQNYGTIEELAFDLYSQDGNVDDTIEFETLNCDLKLVDISLLSKLCKLRIFRMFGSAFNPEVGDNFRNILFDLISRQSKLESVSLRFPTPWTFCKNIIHKHFELLKQISLDPLIIKRSDSDKSAGIKEIVLDMTIFQQCSKLEILWLGRGREFFGTIPIQSSEPARVINLLNLPISMESLYLRNFNILPDDLLLYLASPTHSHNFKKFEVHGPDSNFKDVYNKCMFKVAGFVAHDHGQENCEWQRVKK